MCTGLKAYFRPRVEKPEPRRADIDAIRLCLARHRGLSAASIVWALVPELRDFCAGMTRDSIGDFPWDPSDYARCRRVLDLIPDGATRIAELATMFPGTKWPALVAVWPQLEELWLEERDNPSGQAPKLYALMDRVTK